MTDRQILFSGPMVRSLLDGTKTQTRRILKWPTWAMGAPEDALQDTDGYWVGPTYNGCVARLPIPQIGDHLWVSEAWRTESDYYNDLKPSLLSGEETILYNADADWSDNKSVGRFRPGMFMPRWASRLTLTVTDVRVQRLQDISEADAIAEGCRPFFDKHHQEQVPTVNGGSIEMMSLKGPIDAFRTLWNSINGPDAWADNPWVFATTFTVHKGNIDDG